MSRQEKGRQPGGRQPSSKYRLTRCGFFGNLETATLQDKHSLTHKPPYLANASQKHCKQIGAFGSLTFKKDQVTQKSCCTNRVTPRTTRQPNWNHVDRGNLVHHTVTYHDGKGGSFNLNI